MSDALLIAAQRAELHGVKKQLIELNKRITSLTLRPSLSREVWEELCLLNSEFSLMIRSMT